MLRHVLFAAMLWIATFVGTTLALYQQDRAIAGTETIRFQAAISDANNKYCFGMAGWHDDDENAADIWADGVADCGDPDGQDDDVYASHFGKTDVWWSYTMPAWSYDGEGVFTNCEDVYVQVMTWLPDGSTEPLGWEWYLHTDSTLGPGDWHDIWLGEDQWWASWNENRLGESVWPDDCPTDNFHVHQMYWPPSSPLTIGENPLLVPDTVYTEANVAHYIHQWTGWQY